MLTSLLYYNPGEERYSWSARTCYLQQLGGFIYSLSKIRNNNGKNIRAGYWPWRKLYQPSISVVRLIWWLSAAIAWCDHDRMNPLISFGSYPISWCPIFYISPTLYSFISSFFLTRKGDRLARMLISRKGYYSFAPLFTCRSVHSSFTGRSLSATFTMSHKEQPHESQLEKRAVVSSFIFHFPKGPSEKPVVALFKRSDKVRTYRLVCPVHSLIAAAFANLCDIAIILPRSPAV